jgi:hypothetical protein
MSTKVYFKKTAGKILRWLLWICLFILLILTFVYLLIQTQWGNNLLRKGTQSYLQKKFKTEFTIGGFELDGLHKVGIYHVLLKDRNKDTLVSLDTLSVSINLGDIALRKIGINSVIISNLTARVSRNTQDTNFNYQFILDAFGSDKTQDTSSSGSSWAIDLKKHHYPTSPFCGTTNIPGIITKLILQN